MHHTDASIAALPPKEKPYKVSLGAGLYLWVPPSGVRSYRFPFVFEGRAKTCTIGQAGPKLLLAQARDQLVRLRADIAAGINPNSRRDLRREKEGTQTGMRLREASDLWRAAQRWKPKNHRQVKSFMQNNVLQYKGHLRLEAITADDIHECLERIAARGAKDVANDVRAYCSRIFRFHRKPDPVGALERYKRKRGHFDRVPEHLLPVFLKDVEASRAKPETKIGLLFMLHAVPRTNTMRLLRWEYIDWSGKMICVPAAIMKDQLDEEGQPVKVGDFFIPLSRQSLALLRKLQLITGDSEWLFPGRADGRSTVSNETWRMALKRMGWHGCFNPKSPEYRPNATIHGFRSVFTTVAKGRREICRDDLERKAADRQLDHVDPDETNAAYERDEMGGHRGLYMPERRAIMQRWSNHIDAMAAGKKFPALMPQRKHDGVYKAQPLADVLQRQAAA